MLPAASLPRLWAAPRLAQALRRRAPAAGVARAVTGMAAGAGPGQTDAIAVYVTVPDKDVGRKVAEALVTARLAACVNIIPGVESVYWWDGEINSDQELLLMIKSRAPHLSELTKEVISVHPYDVPEVISVPITGGSAKYLEWINASTSKLPGE